MNPNSPTTLRRTVLNPNAREFVPTALRSSSSATVAAARDETEPLTTSDIGKASPDKAGFSDEESRRYWNSQLPDDILTPDTDFFIPAVEENPQSIASELRAYDSSILVGGLKEQADPVVDTLQWERTTHNGKQLQSVAQIVAHGYSNADRNTAVSLRQSWDHDHALSSYQLSSLGSNWNGQPLNSGNALNYLPALRESQSALKENSTADVLNLLANEFPSLPVHSLADIYQANGGDLSLTVGMLTQLKLQDDGSSWRNMPSPSRFSLNSKLVDFSAPSTPELAGRRTHFLEEVDMQQPTEFNRLVRKNNIQWPYDRNGTAAELSLRPSSFPSLSQYSGLFGGDSPSANEESLELSYPRHNYPVSPLSCLEIDDAAVNLSSELREEARNHARLRNAYFEQAWQAYFSGNKVLTKEAKGQLHNRLMKAAHSKAAEIVFQQRNISTLQAPTSFGSGQTQLLDLRGLHVNEAVTLLKRELSALRLAARSSRQWQQVFISVGTGHAKGSRMPARLLFAVKRYLTEDEGVSFTEPQPGIVRVVVS